MHLALRSHGVLLAWGLTLLSVAPLAWLALDYRALGKAGVLVTDDAVELRIGLRYAAVIPRRQIALATRMNWRDIPAPNARHNYKNITSPADANVMLVLEPPVRVRVLGGVMHRQVTRLALRVEDVEGFLHEMSVPMR